MNQWYCERKLGIISVVDATTQVKKKTNLFFKYIAPCLYPNETNGSKFVFYQWQSIRTLRSDLGHPDLYTILEKRRRYLDSHMRNTGNQVMTLLFGIVNTVDQNRIDYLAVVIVCSVTVL